jgi:hypothetical protein
LGPYQKDVSAIAKFPWSQLSGVAPKENKNKSAK